MIRSLAVIALASLFLSSALQAQCEEPLVPSGLGGKWKLETRYVLSVPSYSEDIDSSSPESARSPTPMNDKAIELFSLFAIRDILLLDAEVAEVYFDNAKGSLKALYSLWLFGRPESGGVMRLVFRQPPFGSLRRGIQINLMFVSDGHYSFSYLYQSKRKNLLPNMPGGDYYIQNLCYVGEMTRVSE